MEELRLNLNSLGRIFFVYLNINFLERFGYVFECLDELDYCFMMENYLRVKVVLIG